MAAIRVIVKGNELGLRELAGVVVIGRGAECDLRLPDADVSRAHCRIERRGSEYEVVDLASRNGTLVEGARVSRRKLRDGDVMRLGNCTLQFEAAPPARRTLDDEVLEMLNDVAPSPAQELELVGAAVREESGAAGDIATVTAGPISASHENPPLAAKLPQGPVPSDPRSKNLWEKALAAPRAVPRPQKRAVSTPALPWYRRRIPPAAAVAAALVATIVVYLLAWGLPDGGPRVDPNKPLHHAKHSRSAD